MESAQTVHLVSVPQQPSPGDVAEVRVPICKHCQREINVSVGLCTRDCVNDRIRYPFRPKGSVIMRVFEYKFIRDEILR